MSRVPACMANLAIEIASFRLAACVYIAVAPPLAQTQHREESACG